MMQVKVISYKAIHKNVCIESPYIHNNQIFADTDNNDVFLTYFVFLNN